MLPCLLITEKNQTNNRTEAIAKFSLVFFIDKFHRERICFERRQIKIVNV